LESISPTFYATSLCAQIPKVQKIQSSCQSFFAVLGSALVKAGNNVGEIHPWFAKGAKKYFVSLLASDVLEQIQLCFKLCPYLTLNL